MNKVKKLLAVVLSLAMVFTGVSAADMSAKADETGYTKIEMESMQINRARIKDKGSDSNGKHVEVFWEEEAFASDDVANNSYVRMVVEAPEAGEYTFKIGCTTWGDVTARAYVNNKKNDITIPAGEAQEYAVSLNLNEGKNVIIFSWINWAEMDYILVPDALAVLSEATDTYYPASAAALNMTWFNTYDSIYNADALLYTGTLYLNVDESGKPGDEEWQPSATFTVDTPEDMKSMKLEYYMEEAVTADSQISFFINGSETPLTVKLDNTGVVSVDTDTLIANGLVLGAKNTIKIKQISVKGGSVGIYSLTELKGDEPITDDVVKTAKELVDNGHIRMTGRTIAADTAQTMDWTCSGFQFDYEGGGTIWANITTGNPSKMIVDINGTKKEVIARKGTGNVVLASDLENGKYTVKVYKTTEANGYLTQLNSISYDKDAVLTATKEADLKFEFVGDSITCGNQINSETGEEDGYGAYASVLARAYGADWNTLSCSGRGLMEGYNSEIGWAASQDAQMKDVFDYVSYFRDKETKYDYSYQPDVLVLNLGSNDLGEDIMNTFGTTMDDFCNEVKVFSTKVREKYPDTKIIWCYGTYLNNSNPEQYREAVESLNDANTVFVNFPQLISGKDGHPNYAQQTRMAKILSVKIAEMLGIANPMTSDIHYEAEEGTITANGTNAVIKKETNLTPYSGNAYAADMNSDVADAKDGAYVTVPVSADKAGIYSIKVSYGTNAGKNPIVNIKSNGYAWNAYEVETAAGWDMIKTFDAEVYLKKGNNTISITGATNGSWANIDCFELEYLREGAEPPVADIEKPTENQTTKVPVTTKKPDPVTERPALKAPGRAAVKKVTNIKGRKAKITLKKIKGAAGYQIEYSQKRNMKKSRKVFTKKITYTVKKLKKKKTYYFRARAYSKKGAIKKYGKWSGLKRIKIKK